MKWTIYQRRVDKLWVAAASYGEAGGKRQRRYLYAKTKSALLDKLRAADVESTGGTLSVARLLEDWLEQEASKRQPKTYDGYRNIVRRHLVPGLGKKALRRLSPDDIDTYLRQKLREGFSPRTVEQHHEVLSAALKWAVKRRKLNQNPASLVTPPSPPKLPRRVLSPDEARRLLQVARGHRLEAMFTVALALGMRAGEVLGLRWEDVDLEAGTITIRHALQRLGSHSYLKAPKSQRSRRTIYLPEVVKEALVQHRERQRKEAASPDYQDNGFVFADERGQPLHPSQPSRFLKALLVEAGIPERLRFHDLRHSCASLLLAQGVHPRLVMELLGHSTIQLTLDTYTHVLPAISQEAARQMDALLTERL